MSGPHPPAPVEPDPPPEEIDGLVAQSLDDLDDLDAERVTTEAALRSLAAVAWTAGWRAGSP